MPHNKSNKKDNLYNESSINEPEVTVKAEKGAKRPPSLNGINKQQS
ncbi:hypothetical protein PAT3040_02470 [Paenibacillus agaridevorans]|jgi:hypothetical protein|uniref:Uncharacterized protein n=1 Tax=Paenibacillus agaridevorans TaxID=171404 RepID=A0A2R5EMK0_9BACL|nr:MULTISPECIES: hypothetical protein [Paenibacillus]GBG07906.1 hypothetical protein PAT3040_02470 [Paenibacillus agaridevorans]